MMVWKSLECSPIPALQGSALVWLKDARTGHKWLASPVRALKPDGEYEAEVQGWQVYAYSACAERPDAATHWLPVTAAFDLLDLVDGSISEEFFKRLLAQVEAHDDFTREVRDDIRRGARTSDHRFKL